jgi:hypothetical protein
MPRGLWLSCWEPQHTAISVVSDSVEILCPELGMILRRKISLIRVSQLTEGPALRSGKININDRLLEIDGHDVKTYCTEDLRRVLIDGHPGVINLMFSRSSFLFGVDFTYKISLGRVGRQSEQRGTRNHSIDSATNQKLKTSDATFSPRGPVPAPCLNARNVKRDISNTGILADAVDIRPSLSIKNTILDKSVAPSPRATISAQRDCGITIFLPDSIETRTNRREYHNESQDWGHQVKSAEHSHGVTNVQFYQDLDSPVPSLEKFAHIFAQPSRTGKRPSTG